MGNWLTGWSSDRSSGYSSDWSPGGSSGVPSGPVHKLEKSIQANLPPNENCLQQIAVSLVPSQKLEEYIQANLKPNRKSLKQIDQAVDAIWDLLRSQIPVKEVAKGGSYGRETALRGCSDGTLVLFIDCFQQFQDQIKYQDTFLDFIELWLKIHEKKSVKHEHALVVQVSVPGQRILLQLLPVFNPLRSSENPSSCVYVDLKKSMDKVRASPGEFSDCFTTLQQRFFKKYPRRLKDLILLVKHWYEQCQEKWKTPPPQSLLYALELLTVYAWEQGGQAEDFDMAQGVRTVLRLIRRPTELCVYWTVNYNFEDETVRNILLHQLRSQRPVILDPTDPTNNVGKDDRFWELLTEEAGAWLYSPSLNTESPAPYWDVLPMPLFITPSHLLDKFIKDFLQPNDIFQKQINKAVDIICPFLKNDCTWNSDTKVLKTVKGGSTAKGTALKRGSDADIVVFLSSLDSYDSLKTNRSQFVQEIQKQLEAFVQAQELEVTFENSKWKAPRVLSFTLKSKTLNESVEFDVLPAYDALGQLRSDFTLRPEAYQELIELCASQDIKEGEFSICFTELQRNFIRTRPTKVKSLLRLIKHWYKQYERKMKPKSLPPKYALELLTVYAWEQGSGTDDFDIAEGFRTVLDLVIKYRQLCIFWTVNYNFEEEYMQKFLLTQIQKKRPVILDPADPTGDVGGGDRWHWHLLAEEAKEWLSSPCFQVKQKGLVQPWKVPVMQTPGSCGGQIYPTVGGVTK
ncbi:2'-5'-oligoadenylate synthase 2 [Mus caroli]|uniref:2'-5' oligoadenylate synthase n=1 Tax=Mus caroli TaxID=10089 RepID=A0A6P5PRI6_MUSCR|nr:2'-5'-oligoadenylate synthase 2 [Mus caroli]